MNTHYTLQIILVWLLNLDKIFNLKFERVDRRKILNCATREVYFYFTRILALILQLRGNHIQGKINSNIIHYDSF